MSYTFDKIGNVDSIHNSAGIINEMGGTYYHKYTYDNFNRISTAHGSWTGDPSNTLGNKASNYTLEMAYENMHRITTKQQEHTRDASNVGENTYDNLFKYEDVNHPNAVTSIENQTNSDVEEFNYDANGNVLLHEFDNGDTKNMLWDEANMLKAIKISNAGSFQHYIYDANGERTLKGLGQYGIMDLNGLSQTVSTIGNYSQYVSGYMVMGPHNMVTNHYYSGTERIACKLVGSVDSSVDNSLELSGSEKAGLPDRQAEDLDLVRTEFGFDTLIIDDVDPDEDDCEGNNDCPNVLYFFHPDHIGSSTYLTDEDGNPYQFILYLPFGESMAEQKAGGYSTKYRFTGKEVDDETGLYYFGARYYDPRISLWYGVDPQAEDAPDWNPYRYGFNNPIRMIDPDGLFETEAEAKAYAKEHKIKTGFFRNNKIVSNKDGSFSIDNKKAGTSTFQDKTLANEAHPDGVYEAPMVAANDIMSMRSEGGGFSFDPLKQIQTLRDGSEREYEVQEGEGVPVGPGGTFKATRILKGLKIGNLINSKEAIKRLKQGKDIYSSSLSVAKNLMKKASGGGKVIKDKARDKGYYDHFHDLFRELKSHSFFGPPK
ncbi:MAG: RHS repeat-associated core domain-containing protein [Saprospiraceae bacterium]|nr:RHS repeat-associated core domain-containing protein [Candidatus Defluviibacterium haderslevense]